MKYFLILAVIGLISCSENQNEDLEIETQLENGSSDTSNLVTPEDPTAAGQYYEYHESGALKIEGIQNEKGNRQGLWISYYENGTKWSESYYVDGKRDGHSLTFYPNGQVRYIGEYKNDEQVGSWKFYDEEGELTNEENY